MPSDCFTLRAFTILKTFKIYLGISISQNRTFYIEAFVRKVVKKLQTALKLVYNNTTECKGFSNNAVKKEIS